MSQHQPWREAQKAEDKIFMKILQECPKLKDKQNPNELSKKALLLWGVTQCGGSSELKVKCFYDIL
ncbi:MAG: hypothetical protein ACK56F_16070 [bacterium]